MTDATDTIGGRVRRARRGKGLTQIELARRLQRSDSWVRGVEAGQITLDRHSAIDRLVNVLDVDIAWLLGQPYQPASPDQDAGQSTVRKLRSALRRTSLILSGHPRISSLTVPRSVAELRRDVDRMTRLRQAALLPRVMGPLPDLIEDLNTSTLEATGPGRDATYGLTVELCHVARMVLNQLGYHDLAWTAVENAALVAARIGDPLILACSAWDRCGVLLHTGSLAETIVVAETAMASLEPDLSHPRPETLSLWGALNLRCAIASARGYDAPNAWSYLREAEMTAQRLGVDRNDFQTVFGPSNVHIHAAEMAVELGQPNVALERSARLDLSAIPSKERQTRHGIDVARAYGQMKRDAAAVVALERAATSAPHYVYNHPMARSLVEQIRSRGQGSAFSVGLGKLERVMGLV